MLEIGLLSGTRRPPPQPGGAETLERGDGVEAGSVGRASAIVLLDNSVVMLDFSETSVSNKLGVSLVSASVDERTAGGAGTDELIEVLGVLRVDEDTCAGVL